MTVARTITAVIAIIIFVAAYYALAIKSEIPAKTPVDKDSGRGRTSTTIEGTRAETVVDNLKISFSVPSGRVKQGDALLFNLSVENTGSEPRELLFGSSQKFDIRIEDTAGQKIWLWSDDKMFAQILETVILKPGKSISYSAEWFLKNTAGDPVKAGEYNAFGKIMTSDLKDKEVKLSITVDNK